jgi:hypothetical protein
MNRPCLAMLPPWMAWYNIVDNLGGGFPPPFPENQISPSLLAKALLQPFQQIDGLQDNWIYPRLDGAVLDPVVLVRRLLAPHALYSVLDKLSHQFPVWSLQKVRRDGITIHALEGVL